MGASELIPHLPAWVILVVLWSAHPSPNRDNSTSSELFPGDLEDAKDNREFLPKLLTFYLGSRPICNDVHIISCIKKSSRVANLLSIDSQIIELNVCIARHCQIKC